MNITWFISIFIFIHLVYNKCLLNEMNNAQDHDHDGRLSLEDFEKAVKEENLLLKAFGKCLPEYMVITNYFNTTLL